MAKCALYQAMKLDHWRKDKHANLPTAGGRISMTAGGKISMQTWPRG
jgi:hypothetical protein